MEATNTRARRFAPLAALLALACALLLALAPAAAWAEDYAWSGDDGALAVATDEGGTTITITGDGELALAADLDATDVVIGSSDGLSAPEVAIDLAGCTITGTGEGSVITVYGGALTLKDSTASETEVEKSDLPEGGVGVYEGSSSDGPGTAWTTYYQDADGAYRAYTSGAVTGGAGTTASLTEVDSSLTGHAVGGGIYVTGSSLTIAGGSVVGNTATAGGGICVHGGSLTISGGSVSGNTASGTVGSSTKGFGGGVASTGVTLVSGGVMSGNSCSTWGGGVFVGGDADESKSLTISGGVISGNSCTAYGGGVVYCGTSFSMEGGQIARNSSRRICGLYVMTSGSGEIEDGCVSYNTSTAGEAGVYLYKCEKFTISGGEISHNTAGTYCGGVLVYDSTLCISGGEISYNVAKSGSAGGVMVYSCSSVTMTGGSIVHNEQYNAARDDNQTYAGGGVNVWGYSTFTMSGGVIAWNYAEGHAGGVHVGSETDTQAQNEGTSFIMTGGVIANNTAEISADDVFVNQYCTVELANPDDANADTVYEADEKGAQIDGWYVDGSGIQTTYGETDRYDAESVTHDDLVETVKFSSDNERHWYLVAAHARWLVTYDANCDDATGTMDIEAYWDSDTVTAAACGYTRSGYIFVGWNTETDGSGAWYITADDAAAAQAVGATVSAGAATTFEMDTADVTLYAQWVRVYTVTYDGNPQGGGTVDGVPVDDGPHATGTDVEIDTETVPEHSDVDGTPVVFIGWSPTQTDDIYGAGDGDDLPELVTSVTATSDTTLYAVWGYDLNGNGVADVFEETYTVTYVDGVDGAEVFADQVYTGLLSGLATPSFVDADGAAADPVREGYTFAGWSPEVASTVTGDAVYTAQWAADAATTEETEPTTTETEAESTEETLSSTGDTTAFAVGGLAAMGAIAIAAGLAARRRRQL